MMLTHAILLAALAATAQPDLIVLDADVITLDTKRPVAEAFAVRAGRFTQVGSNAEIRPLAGPGTHLVSLRGKTVVPGFIDAHAHPRPIYHEDSPWYVVEAGPENVRTLEDLIAAIRRKAAVTPAGRLITGSRYQQTKLGRHPTRHDLDRATTDHPVIISHSS